MAAERITFGVISAVQEGRFRLVDDAGRCHLFILSSRAPIEAADLQRFLHQGCSVRIAIAPATGLIAMVAMRVDQWESDPERDQATAEAR